jgi:hypothetical protein
MDWVGGRAEGIDSERMGWIAACRWPMRNSLMGRFVRARGTGRVRARRGGGGMAVVYTIVLIVSRDYKSNCRVQNNFFQKPTLRDTSVPKSSMLNGPIVNG